MTQTGSEDRSQITIIVLTKAIMLENYDRIKELLDLIPGRKWSREEIIADRPMKWDYSLIAMDNEKIVGVWIISKKGDSRHHHMTTVDEAYRRAGIGSKMTRVSATGAKELGEKFLTSKVEEGNDMSLNFHLKLGLTVYSEEFNEEEGVKYILLRAAPEKILDKLDKDK
ncbi:GNAT family N-acetyltransferase [Candidatus Marinimicrobia bacterium MT.SAG.3]|nr:GNAT family N-acetyltransferase [Candidatus Marinimicrobia bacterium MT.SAG.3]